MKKLLTGVLALFVGLFMTGFLTASAYNYVGSYAKGRATSAGYRAANYGLNKAENKAYDSLEKKEKDKKEKKEDNKETNKKKNKETKKEKKTEKSKK